MAIIKCPECGADISDKAISCPHCGFPLAKEQAVTTTEEASPVTEKEEAPSIPCPDFPEDLRIGQQITNWSFDAAFKGVYSEQLSTMKGILPSGEANILLHSHGLRIMVGLESYDIHNSQIISIVKTSSAELGQVNKSVVGRAVLGDIIMGPLGAIVGGMSGIGGKQGVVVTQYVAINYWDIASRTPQTILLTCDKKQPIDAFIMRQKKENEVNTTENRVAEQEHLPAWALICIIVIIVSVIAIVAT